MGLEFVECVRRSSMLISKYFNKIIEIDSQGKLEEEWLCDLDIDSLNLDKVNTHDKELYDHFA